MWLSLYPYMDKDNFISLDDYKNKVLGTEIITDKSDEEIFKEALTIKKKLGGAKANNGNI